MNSELSHFPNNWKNGMAFSAEHLSSEFLAVIDYIRDATALHLTKFNYGLLGGDSQKEYADSFSDASNNEFIEISRCRAITQNGSRIEILNHNWQELKVPLADLVGSKDIKMYGHWYVVLTVNPFERIPEGIENELESPRRKPHTRPFFKLELISSEEIKRDSLSNILPLLKFETTSTGLKKVEHYIPPCMRLNSHKILIEKYKTYETQLFKLKEYAEEIRKKVDSKRRKKEANQLSEDIGNLCVSYIRHFIHTYDYYKHSLKDAPPIKMIEFFATFARVINYSMDNAYDKSHLLQYFNKYTTDLTAAKLDRVIKNTYETSYFHYDTFNSLSVIDTFLETLLEIFQKLIKLDYRELAARDVITRDSLYNKNEERQPSSKTGIVVKRPGTEGNLGDDLI